jgi:hypothetical protein
MTVGEYISRLWDICWATDPSTFGASSLFSTIWYMELGNSFGFRIAPIQPTSNEGDLTGWLIDWRHAWFSSLMSDCDHVAYCYGYSFIYFSLVSGDW